MPAVDERRREERLRVSLVTQTDLLAYHIVQKHKIECAHSNDDTDVLDPHVLARTICQFLEGAARSRSCVDGDDLGVEHE